MGLYTLLNLRGLLMECHRACRRLATCKEVSAVSALNRRRPIGRVEAFPGRHHGEISSHDLALVE